MYVKDRDLRVVSANRAFCEALGVAREDLLGKPTDPLLGDAGPESARMDREIITSGSPRLGVVESYPSPQGLRWVLTDKVPIKDADGTTIGLVGTSADITERKKAEDELQRSESQLRFLSENMADVIWTMDMEFRTTYISPSVERVLGFTPEEWMQLPFDQMSTAESVEREYTALQRELAIEASSAADPDRTLTVDVEMYCKDGSTLWMEMVIRAIRDDIGNLVGMLGVSRDISERKRATEALRKSEEKYKTLFEQSIAPISLISPEGRVLETNQAWRELFGYSVEDLRELNVRDQYPDPAERARFLKTIRDKGRLVDDEIRLKRKDGVILDLLRSTTVRRKPNGDIIGFQNVFRDITAQKRAEQELKGSEEQYRQLFEQSVDAVSLIALDGTLLASNPAWFALFGYTVDDLPSLNVRDLYVDPGDRDEFLKAIAGHERLEGEVQFRRKDRTVFDCHRVVIVLHASDGSVIGFQAFNRDITAQKQAELSLRESEQKFRELFEQSVDAINLVSPDGRILEANPAWFKLFGYTPEDMSSYNARDAYVDPSGRASFLEKIARQDSVEDETQFRRKDGTVFDCHRIVRARRAPDGAVVGFQTVFHDVTETKKAEQALRESEETYRSLFELSRDAIYLVRPDGTFIYVNQAWLNLLGCTRDEMSKYDASHWYAEPDGRARYLERMAKAGTTLDDEVKLKRKDGTVFDCQRRIVAQQDKDGNTIAFHGVMRDITEEKRAEQALRESEEKYRALFDQSIAPISLFRADGSLIDANDAWLGLFGYAREDIPRLSAYDLYYDPSERDQTLRRALAEGRLVDDEARMRKSDGTPVDVQRLIVVRHNPDGSIFGFQAVWRDITRQKAAEQALRESEQKYRAIFDQPVAPISVLAPDGHLIEANDAWFHLFGYEREDMASINAANLYPTPELREESLRRLLRNGLLLDDEARVKTKDGRIIDVLRSMVVRHNADGSVLGYQTVWRDITELTRTRNELFASREQLRRLALRIQEAREQERTDIAQELHDHFSQELTALRLDMDALTRSGPPEGDAGLVRIRGILQLVDQMSLELRRVISDMRPGMLDDLGLCAAIDWQAGQFSERTGISCDLVLTANDCIISPELSTTLFRILQELLSNVAQHSGASSASISLARSDDAVRLTVSDNGRGITEAESEGPLSLGILGIRERLRAHGGSLVITSSPGTGTSATAVVPLYPVEEEWQTRLGLG